MKKVKRCFKALKTTILSLKQITDVDGKNTVFVFESIFVFHPSLNSISQSGTKYDGKS